MKELKLIKKDTTAGDKTMSERPMRIAAFGFRSLPPRAGSAGADKFADELYPRLVKRGCEVTAYVRQYDETETFEPEYNGVKVVSLKTVKRSGFDTLLHSFYCMLHIIVHNTAKVVHIHNGGNALWCIPLRLAGKRTYISQDGIDWKRDKWPWYAKMFLNFSSMVAAYVANKIIFDNIYAKNLFEKRYRRSFAYISYGSETPEVKSNGEILDRLGLKAGDYFLFVGRFIPDKGIHLLLEAFCKLQTKKKLVLVGGSPNASEYENGLRAVQDSRVVFAGFLYGTETNCLIKNAYAYVQPSLIEGLSPVILTVMGIGTPLICSDIQENLFAVGDTATCFSAGDANSLYRSLESAVENPEEIRKKAAAAKERALSMFSWDAVAEEHLRVFAENRRY